VRSTCIIRVIYGFVLRVTGTEINTDNAVTGFEINNLRETEGVAVELITTSISSSMKHKADKIWNIKSYYHFVKALNHFYISRGMENTLFINGRCSDFDAYKTALMQEDFSSLLEDSGFCCPESFEEFAAGFNREMNAIIVFSEKEVSPFTSLELINLSMITGKLGKRSMGIMALKEKNNSQGLFDMGIIDRLLPGKVPVDDKQSSGAIAGIMGIEELPAPPSEDHISMLESGLIKNMFIFGEDPAGCALDKKMAEILLNKSKFIMVQEYFMSDTALMADLVMPASFPFEIGGTYSNTGKVALQFEKHFESVPGFSTYEQLQALVDPASVRGKTGASDIRMEIFSLLSHSPESAPYKFCYTANDNYRRLFGHGCDYLVKRFDSEFSASFDIEPSLDID
jgi:formate dehydrogenase major subunit